MTGRTHLAAGITTGLGACLLLKNPDPNTVTVSVLCSSLGSLMPDIDTHKATISHLGFLSRGLATICSSISTHRRFWHTPIAGIIFATTTMLLFLALRLTQIPLVSIWAYNIPLYIPFIMFYFGWLSHLLLDSCNPQGVPWFFPAEPLSKKKSFKRISVTTASNKEIYYKVLFALTAFALILLWVNTFTHDILSTIYHTLI